MIRSIFRRSFLFTSAYAAPKVEEAANSSTLSEKEPVKGWIAVRNIFSVDEDGEINRHLSTIYQTTILSALFGACYGGIIHSREAYLSYMERNEASQYASHFDAKKKLQDFITVNFAKGAIKWSWRIAAFGGMYISFVTVLSVYFGESSVWHYVLGGLLSGGLYRLNYGLKGFVAGSTLGLFIGLFAGTLTMTVLRFTGSTMDDVKEWQHQLLVSRNKNLSEATRKAAFGDSEQLLKRHDQKLEEQPIDK